MTKIAAEHLARGAFVYVRQSTTDQVRNNHESRRRQYGLADRARTLGWSTVEIIDDDLGRSGSGVSRPALRSFSPRSAKAALVLWCRSKRHGWLGTVATGIRCLSSAALLEPSSLMRTASMIRAVPMTGCCWG